MSAGTSFSSIPGLFQAPGNALPGEKSQIWEVGNVSESEVGLIPVWTPGILWEFSPGIPGLWGELGIVGGTDGFGTKSRECQGWILLE